VADDQLHREERGQERIVLRSDTAESYGKAASLLILFSLDLHRKNLVLSELQV
jgi:hypothetical protein